MYFSWKTACKYVGYGTTIIKSRFRSSVASYTLLQSALCFSYISFACASPVFIALSQTHPCLHLQSFGYCGQKMKLLLTVIGSAFFSIFPNSEVTTDIDEGIVFLLNSSFSTNLKDKYVIDPSLAGRAGHASISAPSITARYVLFPTDMISMFSTAVGFAFLNCKFFF